MGKDTIAELFELSISAEREAQAFYASLAGAYSAHDVAVRFFHDMRQDEERHIDVLTRMRGSLSKEDIKKPVPPHAASLITAFLNFSATVSMANINDLEDAYRMVVNLEFSELNKLHELLIDLFAPGEETRRKSFEMIKAHLRKIEAFHDATGDTVARRGVLPS